MAPAGQTNPPLRVLLGVAGVVAMLGPVVIVLMVGWAVSLTVALAAGLAVSLLLTLLLLAGGWWLLQRLEDLTPSTSRGDVTPPTPLSNTERGGDLPSSDSPEGEIRNPVPARLLLVEDDPIGQRIVARLLQGLRVQADVVADGQAALDAVATSEYALVLMDCQLPGMDGYAATAEIRRRESASTGRARRLPIVALTSSARDADRRRAVAAGMDEQIIKPLDLQQLAALLARWGLHHEELAAIPDRSFALDSRNRPPILDSAGLPAVNGRLSEPYHEIVQLYRREAALRMDALGAAAALPDRTQVAQIAHTLAGSSSSIGALRMAAACVALEVAAKETTASAPACDSSPSPERSSPGGRADGNHPEHDRTLAEAFEDVRRELQVLETALADLTVERPPV